MGRDRDVKLSQCMIVKNEEKNIRRALSWAKDLAFEQIVVDTGSTDRTVEIAEEMGAKVYHFQWVDDFAAAKNYAIEQASGEWIAFLDADEYFTDKGTTKLRELLRQMQIGRDGGPLFIRCAWIHLNDDGKPFMVSAQDRIFRNTPRIRYQGKIHEQIVLDGGKGRWSFLDAQKMLSIYHTGYTRQAYKETGKLQRNIRLLEKETEQRPEDYGLWAYLGDSYLAAGDGGKAEKAYLKALKGKVPSQISRERSAEAGKSLLCIYALAPAMRPPEEELLRIARRCGYPKEENPDLYYYLALCLGAEGKYEKAYVEMGRALEKVETYTRGDTVYMLGNLDTALAQMAGLCQNLGKEQETVRYATLALKLNPRMDKVLAQILILLRDEKGEAERADGTWGFLGKLYDLEDTKDLLFLYKCASGAGFEALARRALDAMPQEVQEEILRAVEEDGETDNPWELSVCNRTDRRFLGWAKAVRGCTQQELVEWMKGALQDWKTKGSPDYSAYVNYLGRFPLWGRLDPDSGEYETLERRAHMMKAHLEDLVWLYRKLADYRSRNTLLGVLLNWTYLNTQLLGEVRERTQQYFDLDLIPAGKGEVFVDLGAYVGDSISAFIHTYGKGYKRIYAYEPDRKNASVMERNLAKYPDIEIRKRGAGSEKGMQAFRQGGDPFANHFMGEEGADAAGQEMAEITTLDEDITEAVSWIKMDVEGGEYDALLGASGHIRREKPKLTISVYHGYDDLWRLARLIDEMNPGYRFYLRYYGGNLFPTGIVLTALP